MGLSLQKGQSLSLTKQDGSALSRVRLALGWDAVATKRGLFGGRKEAEVDLDASAIFFDVQGAPIDYVWFNQLRSRTARPSTPVTTSRVPGTVTTRRSASTCRRSTPRSRRSSS